MGRREVNILNNKIKRENNVRKFKIEVKIGRQGKMLNKVNKTGLQLASRTCGTTPLWFQDSRKKTGSKF